SLHLGRLRPPPSRRLPARHQSGRGTHRRGGQNQTPAPIAPGALVKALVTGAGGFVGTALVAHLQAEGDEVVGIDHVSGPDITDPAGVREVVERHRPDAVYHLAAVTHIGASWDAPLDVFRINAEGTLNLLSACAATGVDRVLVIGSADE